MKNSTRILVTSLFTATLLSGCAMSESKTEKPQEISVRITPTMASVVVRHNGADVTLMRNQDPTNTINPDFQKTSRQCPPFCITPMHLEKGVETVAELEVIASLQKIAAGDDTIMVVDNRTPNWYAKGTIPGAINVPYTRLNRGKGADDVSIAESLELFGAKKSATGWDFNNAKTLYLFCNGMWCSQSVLSVTGLIDEGYPAEKIKWYRGGMQDWEILGLTTIKP